MMRCQSSPVDMMRVTKLAHIQYHLQVITSGQYCPIPGISMLQVPSQDVRSIHYKASGEINTNLTLSDTCSKFFDLQQSPILSGLRRNLAGTSGNRNSTFLYQVITDSGKAC